MHCIVIFTLFFSISAVGQTNVLHILVSGDAVQHILNPKDTTHQFVGTVDNLEIKNRPTEGFQITEHIRTTLGEPNKTKLYSKNPFVNGGDVHLLFEALADTSLTKYFSDDGPVVATNSATVVDVHSEQLETMVVTASKKEWRQAGKRLGMKRKTIRKHYTARTDDEILYAFLRQRKKELLKTEQQAWGNALKLVVVTTSDTLYLVGQTNTVAYGIWQQYGRNGEWQQSVYLPQLAQPLAAILPKKFNGKKALGASNLLMDCLQYLENKRTSLLLSTD